MVTRGPVAGQRSTAVARYRRADKEYEARLGNIYDPGGWRSLKAKIAVYFPTPGSVTN